MCVCYMRGFGYNGCVTMVQPFPMNGHYKTGIISGVGYPRSDSVVPLMLCMAVYTQKKKGLTTLEIEAF